MRKVLLMVLVSLVLASFAKKPATVSFKEVSDDIEYAGIISLLGASQVVATIHADSSDAKYYEIWMVNCKGGEKTRTLMGFRPVSPDSTKICISAMPKDSLSAYIHVGPYVSVRHEVEVPTFQHLLVACDYDWEFNDNDTIPLMGYTTGIPKKFDLGDGKMIDGWYVCGIRFSKVHPSEWQKSYGIPDYLYFEAIPVKERDLTKYN